MSRVLYSPKEERLSFIYSMSCPIALAFYPPLHSERKLRRTALNQWYTRTCNLQQKQPICHHIAGGLLHRLLTLTYMLKTMIRGYFLLSTPTVTNSSYFREWSVLAARTFLSSHVTSDRPGYCFYFFLLFFFNWSFGMRSLSLSLTDVMPL